MARPGWTIKMDEVLGYIKYITVGAILSPVWFKWTEMISTAGEALFVGFMGAVGAFLGRIVVNWLRGKFPIFRSKKDDPTT